MTDHPKNANRRRSRLLHPDTYLSFPPKSVTTDPVEFASYHEDGFNVMRADLQRTPRGKINAAYVARQ
jgi:hypothetical protein